ncbi:MmcQ/YjbR family DNA-binding protein [Flavobacteriaceae bacterium R38]|nr:MmcQ/YjbR family DNA-binding protein [Flavobacteriaceae bacterium R38]
MNIEELHQYCINKKGTTEGFPFDEDTLVFKVMGKMFALTSLKKWEAGERSVNLKCDPEWALELREQYESVRSGFHMNNKHWNTVDVGNNELPKSFVYELIDHSYDMVVKGMTKKLREALNNL